MPGRPRDAPFLATMAALVASAWVLLWLWSASPYGRWADHGAWTDLALVNELCRSVPGGRVLIPAAMHAGGWVLMTVAMMLPTTLPLLTMFYRLSSARANGGRLLALVVAGYLAAWGSFGLVAFALDDGIHRAASEYAALGQHSWVLGATVLAGAGLFQFSSLKRRCLEKCRTPLAFVADYWRKGGGPAGAWRLGLRHGAYCVGCCWALMLLMFVVGMGSLGWMFVLAAAMATEKNLPWGRRLSAPLGLTLLGWSAALVSANL